MLNFEIIFSGVSFNIDTDWKLGLIGRNGKGKTTFLKLLQGIYEYKGTISKNVDVDYFPFEVSNKNKMAIEFKKSADSKESNKEKQINFSNRILATNRIHQ